MKNEEFIKKGKLIHGEFYGYGLVDYLNSKTKIKIICPKHGEFEQSPRGHLSGKKCFKCGVDMRSALNLSSTEEFIKKAKLVHGDLYDYTPTNYFGSRSKIKIVCLKHGEFEQTPDNHTHSKNGCPSCKISKGEQKIKEFLLNNKIKFIPQFKFSNCKHKQQLPFDFYLPEMNICIEYHGRQHYESVKKFGGELEFDKIKIRDKIKIEYCKNNNIQLIVFKYNKPVINKLIKLIHPEAHRTIL